MMKGTILIFSPVHWNSPWEIGHSIATTFAKYGYDLVFIEPIPKRWPKLTEARRVFGRLFGRSELSGHAKQQSPHENIHIYSPVCLPDTGVFFRRLNLAFFLKRIKNDLLGLIRQQPVYGLNFTPVSLAIALMENLPIEVRGYFCVSDWQNHPFIKESDVFEKEMLGLADIAWADSPYLFEKIRQINSNTKQMLPAISAELIDRFASNETFKSTQDEILCAIFGTIGVHTDVDLLIKTSQRYQLRIIGPVRASCEGISPKTEFIPPVPHQDLPKYLSDVDVILLIYKKDLKFNQGVIPAKTIECLATGKPTVVYGISSLEIFDDLFYICETHEQFLDTIPKTINEGTMLRQRRIETARQHTWESRVKEMEAQMLEVIAKKPR